MCVLCTELLVVVPLHVHSGTDGEAFRSFPNLSVGPSAVILTSEIASCSLNSVADLLGVGIYSLATDLCKRFSLFMLIVLFSHTFSHADSFIFPACQTGAFSVCLQE